MNTNRALSPRESAIHILGMLREYVGGFPKHATPKYPLPVIMKAEDHAVMLKMFLKEAEEDMAIIGTDDSELNRLVEKAATLRDRFSARQKKLKGGVS